MKWTSTWENAAPMSTRPRSKTQQRTWGQVSAGERLGGCGFSFEAAPHVALCSNSIFLFCFCSTKDISEMSNGDQLSVLNCILL